MKPYVLHRGDVLDVLRTLPDNSVDSIVTDPPYELGFMGKSWDASGIAYSVEMWREALRVLKPGGHLLAFSGSRTYHRMTCAIEDAGFEVRDQIMWVYGSGFPKSLDVSKAIDKQDASDLRRERQLRFTEWMRGTGLTSARIDEITGTNMGGHYTTLASQPAVATRGHLEKLRPFIAGQVPAWVEALVDERTVESEDFKRREILGRVTGAGAKDPTSFGNGHNREYDATAPATDAARQWEGWGTALKPAHEPICVARKPLAKGCTVAANVLQFGTGGLNIDACRVEPTGESRERVGEATQDQRYTSAGSTNFAAKLGVRGGDPAGRWPANLIHDGSDEVLALFPDAKGQQGAITGDEPSAKTKNAFGEFDRRSASEPRRDDEKSAARFFYCAKASKSDRNSGLDSYVYIDIQWSFTEFGDVKWESEARKVRLRVATEQSPPKVIGVSGAPNKSDTEWSTMLFGSESMGQSPKDMTSTTKTKTSCITTSGILNCFQSFSTNVSIQDVNCATAPGGSRAENAVLGPLSISTTNAWMASALGAETVASPMQLKISVSAAQSGHPTVKPTDLMAYLCRLITPPGGVVLDPFMGSGSTGKACMREGFEFVGIDKDEGEHGQPAGYLEIATARIEHELARVAVANTPPPQSDLFGSAA